MAAPTTTPPPGPRPAGGAAHPAPPHPEATPADFVWRTGVPDMHQQRRAGLLHKHATRALLGTDPVTAGMALGVAVVHVAVAYWAAHLEVSAGGTAQQPPPLLLR